RPAEDMLQRLSGRATLDRGIEVARRASFGDEQACLLLREHATGRAQPGGDARRPTRGYRRILRPPGGCGVAGRRHRASLRAGRHVTSVSVSRPRTIIDVLREHRPSGDGEAEDVARIRELAQTVDDPWRSMPLHVTASALIVHPPTQRVLLRWHQRQQAWLQVGGHGEPGESAPLEVALREGGEETGLADLTPWPDARLVHTVIVPVPQSGDDPAHEHADLRFLLTTTEPERARPERPA